jgi:hypothetical protein
MPWAGWGGLIKVLVVGAVARTTVFAGKAFSNALQLESADVRSAGRCEKFRVEMFLPMYPLTMSKRNPVRGSGSPGPVLFETAGSMHGEGTRKVTGSDRV